MDDQSKLTELTGEEADTLAAKALETEYFGRLEAYLADEHGESVPTDGPSAFERGDGVRAVSFADEPDAAAGETRPDLAVTIHFGDEEVVQATAERHDADDGTVEFVFPTELAPRPEAAVNDLLEPEGQEVTVTVDESADEITAYSIEL